MYMKGHGLAGSYFNLKCRCLILPRIKCSPPPKTVFFPHWFIFCLFNKYFTGYSSLTSAVSKYWCFIRKVALQKDFFQWSQKTAWLQRHRERVVERSEIFFFWWKNKLMLLNCEHTSFFFFFEKEIYHHRVSFVVLGFYKPWHVIFPLLLPCQNIDILSGTLFIFLLRIFRSKIKENDWLERHLEYAYWWVVRSVDFQRKLFLSSSRLLP